MSNPGSIDAIGPTGTTGAGGGRMAPLIGSAKSTPAAELGRKYRKSPYTSHRMGAGQGAGGQKFGVTPSGVTVEFRASAGGIVRTGRFTPYGSKDPAYAADGAGCMSILSVVEGD